MSVLLVSSDLLVSSQVSGAAARTEVKVMNECVPGKVAARCRADSPSMLLLDLSLPELDVRRLVTEVRSVQPSPRIIAFGPHVQTSLLAQAREAGCDQVLSRGAVHAHIDDILRSLSSSVRAQSDSETTSHG